MSPSPTVSRWAFRWGPAAVLSVLSLLAVFELKLRTEAPLSLWVQDWGIYEVLVILGSHVIGIFAVARTSVRVIAWGLVLVFGCVTLAITRALDPWVLAPFLVFMAIRVPMESSRERAGAGAGEAMRAMLIRVPAFVAAVVAGAIFVGLIGGPPASGSDLSRSMVEEIHMRMVFIAAAAFYFPAVEWAETRFMEILEPPHTP